MKLNKGGIKNEITQNDLKFVPERTFEDVVSDVRALHGLEDWKPEAVTKK